MPDRTLRVSTDVMTPGRREADASPCQLERAPQFTRPLRLRDILHYPGRRHGRRLWLKARQVLSNPLMVYRKLTGRPRPEAGTEPAPIDSAPPLRLTPPLQAGELVRVRAVDEIARTLDADGRCDGMSYLGVVMDRYAGRTFTVRKRIDYFFDERSWKMRRLRDAVILEGAYCEPAIEAGVAWAGCSRSCFLFWKEAWLERVDSPPASG
jgi:hypothetical protein